MQQSTDNYFFILGSHPVLSLAEIFGLASTRDKEFVEHIFSSDYLISQTDVDDDFFYALGGVIKYGKIFWQGNDLSFDQINSYLQSLVKDQKFVFGFSLYGFPKSEARELQSELKKLGLSFKKHLKKENNVSSRLVESKEVTLSSVIVSKEKVLEKGAEIVIIKNNSRYYLGSTQAVQDWEAFSQVDYGKPERDSKRGMLPPKLARIMINLSGAKKDSTLVDPFCGIGTVLIEAGRMNINQVYGSDIDGKAIADCKKNIRWLQSNYHSDSKFDCQKIDVSKLSQWLAPNTVDCIVTEPYLGPPWPAHKLKKELDSIKPQLEKLYIQAFREFYKVVKPGGRVVMVWPLFVLANKEINLQINQAVEEMGWKQHDPMPLHINSSVNKELKQANKYLYGRSGQLVWRQITIWQK